MDLVYDGVVMGMVRYFVIYEVVRGKNLGTGEWSTDMKWFIYPIYEEKGPDAIDVYVMHQKVRELAKIIET